MSSYNLSTATLAHSTQAARDIRHQSDASEDLAVVSWPPEQRIPIGGSRGGYYYNVLKGINQYIYVIDHGINLLHPVRPSTTTSFSLIDETGFSSNALQPDRVAMDA